MLITVLAFLFVLLWLGREDLGYGPIIGVLGLIAALAVIAFLLGGIWPAIWAAALAVFDACLMLWIFGRDIRIR